jgi:hypothetical protein
VELPLSEATLPKLEAASSKQQAAKRQAAKQKEGSEEVSRVKIGEYIFPDKKLYRTVLRRFLRTFSTFVLR